MPMGSESRRVQFSEDVGFEVVFHPSSQDPITQSYAAGHFPHSTYSGLLPDLLQPNAAVLDLGAHIGSFALVAAAHGCRVIAVEASRRNVELLRASATLNGFDNLTVVHAAISDQSGHLEFASNGPFGWVHLPTARESHTTVRAVTVDDLVAEINWTRVDLIKLDIEGSEVAAIAGMAQLLARTDAPQLVYEINSHTLQKFGQTSSTLKAALTKHGFSHYLIEPGELTPTEVGGVLTHTVTDNLAVKGLPKLPHGWRIVEPPDCDEITSQLVAEAGTPNEYHRLHVIRELDIAPRWLQDHQAIRQTLLSLRDDPAPAVHSAATVLLTKWEENRSAQSPEAMSAKRDGDISHSHDSVSRRSSTRRRMERTCTCFLRRLAHAVQNNPRLDPTARFALGVLPRFREWLRGRMPLEGPQSAIPAIESYEPILRDDVVKAYRALLGRDPENESVISRHMTQSQTLRGLYLNVVDSPEFQVRAIDRRIAPDQNVFPAEQNSPYVVTSAAMGALVVRRDDSVIGASLRSSGDFESDELTRTCAFLRGLQLLPSDGLDCFVDVGANIGTHTLHAISNLDFSRVIAIEPDVENHRLLRVNIVLNSIESRVTLVRAAASDRSGTAKFRLSPVNRGDHRVVGAASEQVHNEHSWPTEYVPIARLDDIVESIDVGRSLVWVDTQGHECSVLRGMSKLLKEGLPVAFEFWPYGMHENGGTVDELIQILYGYELRNIQTPEFDVVEISDLTTMFAAFLSSETLTASPHTMLLAIPHPQPAD